MDPLTIALGALIGYGVYKWWTKRSVSDHPAALSLPQGQTGDQVMVQTKSGPVYVPADTQVSTTPKDDHVIVDTNQGQVYMPATTSAVLAVSPQGMAMASVANIINAMPQGIDPTTGNY